ncbi:coiled-coil domain-containing protein 191 [Hippocampus comes]|uniref:coiled-coil domain-containing protein 191 n=1 Tax=Hippocampus comes TaxID=109280 RepID=UPI00094E3136|nr:PREDICTED: coiled-coil domain-containing protein 191 [Hippocampus comes]
MAALPGPEPHLFKIRKSTGKNGRAKPSASKKHENKEDIDHWRKRVEKASEFALSEVFFPRRAQTGSKSLAMALRSWEQLRDHDEAYAEAQTLLGDWLDNTWKPELDLETHGLTCEKGSPATPPPPEFNYDNFDDLYHHLADEEDHCAVDNFLQDLKKQKVLDGGMMEKLVSDGGGTNRTFTDPVVTMELRHRQVRENRALNEEEAKMRREREQEERKRQEARRRQQERVQQEIVRMRRQREERKALEQRLRYRDRLEGQWTSKSIQPAPSSLTMQQQQPEENAQQRQEKKVEIFVHLHNLKCLQRHFSRWYSAVMEQRLRMGKAKALCDWKRQLGAWQAWRTVMWAGRNQREVSKTEEELRTENRQRQLAEESDRRRLQRRYLHEWRLWCRQERDQRELLAQQQETRRKMAALIDAATTGQFKPPDTLTSDPPDNTGKDDPRKPVKTRTRVHFSRLKEATTEAQQGDQEADKPKSDDDSTDPKTKTSHGSCFENRHAAQKKIILQQRRQLKEQQEEIAKLKREKVMSAWQLEARKTSASRQMPQPREPTEAAEPDSPDAPPWQKPKPPTCPIISAMEERARVRAERKKQTEELKRVKEEEKQAEMKAAEERKLREEEVEKAQKLHERRLARMKEEEKLKQMKQERQLLDRARRHYDRQVLRRRGLAPWKCLIELKQANEERAENHHSDSLLKRCLLRWRLLTREALSEKEACADRLHHRLLLRRSLSYWKRLEDLRLLQESQADVFCRAHTLSRFLRALRDHVIQEKRLALEHQQMAEEHDNRAALRRCFQAWRLLPCLERKEREREERRERLCRKVNEVLPSFWSRPL